MFTTDSETVNLLFSRGVERVMAIRFVCTCAASGDNR
jgi:hypothetical protein